MTNKEEHVQKKDSKSTYKERYWVTLIHMQAPEDKEKIKEIAKRMSTPKVPVSPSRIVGRIMRKFIESYESQHGQV